MSKFKLVLLISQITVAMVFFQNCSEVQFEDISQQNGTSGVNGADSDVSDLSNQYPFQGEPIVVGNNDLMDELAKSQLEECLIDDIDVADLPGKSSLKKIRNCKVTICHIPDGNINNSHTISISIAAVKAHVDDEGLDYLGRCEDDGSQQIVDDGGLLVDDDMVVALEDS
ncbi:MAG: hypothetical protein HOO06_06135 [Bdellovibrionaceae bacterium]|jgi:hypothetical protein|nr:hypothetical protein [Pseudobdellovibrionaceae bacterium]